MTLNDLADELYRARAEARRLDLGAWRDVVRNVDDGYAAQSLLAARARNAVLGWKVTGLSAEQQRQYDTSRPVGGALLAPFVHAAPATLALKTFVTPLLECEVAFRLGADLPPRDKPYTRADIEVAVDAAVPVMEIADCRWPNDAPGLLKLADSMGNGAFVTGAPVAAWRTLDRGAIDVTLSHDGKVSERGSSARILGDPLLAVIELANAQPLPSGGLKRGQIVTTGTCTTPIPLQVGRYNADFGALGSLRIDIVA